MRQLKHTFLFGVRRLVAAFPGTDLSVPHIESEKKLTVYFSKTKKAPTSRCTPNSGIYFLLILCFFLMTGCQEQSQGHRHPMQEFYGRDQGNPEERQVVYRGRVPEDWIRQDPFVTESITDTTKPICAFIIPDVSGHEIRLSIHSFPTENLAQSIPPTAQVARWKTQLTGLDPLSEATTLQAHGGFAGLCFEGSGFIKNRPTTMLAWAMQLAPVHHGSLCTAIALTSDKKTNQQLRQMRADYTIKASGDPASIARHKQEIVDFAQSFELIREIPSSQ